MTKKREQSAVEKVEEGWDITIDLAHDETEQIPDGATIEMYVEEHAIEAEPVDELTTIYQNAYAQAKSAGAFEGDAKAIAYRSARTWAREHNRRMPDRF